MPSCCHFIRQPALTRCEPIGFGGRLHYTRTLTTELHSPLNKAATCCAYSWLFECSSRRARLGRECPVPSPYILKKSPPRRIHLRPPWHTCRVAPCNIIVGRGQRGYMTGAIVMDSEQFSGYRRWRKAHLMLRLAAKESVQLPLPTALDTR